ncbi:hypothetical protein [Streptomyces sp. NA02950]|uniref:hypothetical protein n=1 Tax=Streptomyces sp. NA02950 TaxID=2742137 RepID=UPI001C37ACF0|nr:hypothetical protein [Streptomyces sp. NA02950]
MAEERPIDEPQQEAAEASEGRAVLVQLIASKELPRIRQRGLDDLDLSTHNRKPVDCERIEQLARLHSEKKGVDAHSRPALVRGLIDDALSAYAEHKTASATFIRDLFFSSQDTTTPLSPGDLLDDARKKSGLSSGAFDRLRRKEFSKFAEFLAHYVLRDATVSRETARVIYRVPKGYELVRVGYSRRILRVTLITTMVLGVLMLGGVWAFRLWVKHGLPLEVASAPAQTYKEPSTDSPTGPTLKTGEHLSPECLAKIINQEYEAEYWARIKTDPWKGYYAPMESFEDSDNKVRSLLANGVPYCPTK